jgi:pimeloyl-ACP methyl ester carboxylesterase
VATATKSGFRLTGADGGPVRGDIRTAGATRPAVVICHGFKGFKDWGFFPVAADRLAAAGFTAVSFNFSGSGVGEDGETFDEADRFGHATCSGHARDFEVVYSAIAGGVLGVRPSTIGVLGHSMGGGVAILGAAAHGEVGALVTWAAVAHFERLWTAEQRAQWRRSGKVDVVNQRTGMVLPLYTDMLVDLEAHRQRLDVLRAAATIAAPWLIIHGSADESVPATDAVELSTAAPRARLLEVPETGHTFGVQHPWAGSTPAFDQVLESTIDWLVTHLG